MNGTFSKEAVQRPKSTAAGEELNLSLLRRAHNNRPSILPRALVSLFCLCFPARQEEDPRSNEDSVRKGHRPEDFKYPLTRKITEEKQEEKPEPQKTASTKMRKVSLEDFMGKYPLKTLFFLSDEQKKRVFLVRITEVEREERKVPRVNSRVTKSMNNECQPIEDFSPDIKEIRASATDKTLAYLLKRRAKSGLLLLITGKGPEAFALQHLKSPDQFLFVLGKFDRLHSPSPFGGKDNPTPLPFEMVGNAMNCFKRNFRGKFDYVIIDFTSMGIFADLFNKESSSNKEKVLFLAQSQILEGFTYSENLVLMFPSMLELSWLAGVFQGRKKDFGLEIELFTGAAKKIEVLIVYVGRANRIAKQDALDHMSHFLNRDCSFPVFKENINHFLGHLTGKLGFARVFRYMLCSEGEKCCKNSTIFQRFLDLVKENERDRVCLEDIQEFLSHEKKTDKPQSFFENCSAASLGKKRKKSDHSIRFSREKTHDFDASLLTTHRKFTKTKTKGKNSRISNPSDQDLLSFSEYWIENPDLGSSTDSNAGLNPREQITHKPQAKKKAVAREKSV